MVKTWKQSEMITQGPQNHILPVIGSIWGILDLALGVIGNEQYQKMTSKPYKFLFLVSWCSKWNVGHDPQG